MGTPLAGDIVTTGAGRAMKGEYEHMHVQLTQRIHSPITVIVASSLAVAVVPPVTVTRHVYVPSSWSARGLIVRLPV